MPPPRPRPGTLRAQILELAEAKKEPHEIAAAVKRDVRVIYVEISQMRARSLLPPKTTSPRRQALLDRVAELHEQGKKTAEIAAIVKCSAKHVCYVKGILRAQSLIEPKRKAAPSVPARDVTAILQAVLDRLSRLEAEHQSLCAVVARLRPSVQAAAPRQSSAIPAQPPALIPASGQSRLSQPPPVPATEHEIRGWAATHGLVFAGDINLRRVNAVRAAAGQPPYVVSAPAGAVHDAPVTVASVL